MSSSTRLDNAALAQLFLDARTANGFTDEPVAPELLQQIYDLARMGATSMNCQPARYVFLTTPEARERLLPYLMEGNKAKTLAAPVCVIVATDTRFYEHMGKTWHDPSGQQLFAGNAALAAATAQRNGTLSGAYFMLAARALGLDCGPMSGFDAAGVNQEFFPDGRLQANFLLNLGHIDSSKTFPRNPRLSFEQACQML